MLLLEKKNIITSSEENNQWEEEIMTIIREGIEGYQTQIAISLIQLLFCELKYCAFLGNKMWITVINVRIKKK